MTRFRHSITNGGRITLPVRTGVVMAALLVAWAAAAQTSQSPVPPGQFNSSAGQAASPPPPPPSPPSGVPGYRPGLIDAFGRWMEESTAGFNANVNAAWSALPGRGMTDAASDAASSAARSTADAAKGAAAAGQGVANAMGSVARDTAGALARLPGAHIAVGRERCTFAPNGAPDCRAAAQALCRTQGLAGGNSVDLETTENCSPEARMARWRGQTVTCPTENYVTRSLCQ